MPGKTALRNTPGEKYGLAATRRAVSEGSCRGGVRNYQRRSQFSDCVRMVHLKRDFQAMVDRNNRGSSIGSELLLLSDVLFGWWHRVRDGTLSRRTLQRYVAGLREDVLAVL
jgi:hypothetical protein